MPPTTEKAVHPDAARAHRLEAEMRQAGGDASAAIRAFSGLSLAELAGRLGVPGSSLGQCLRQAYGRTYPGIRRALEAELKLPPYALDELMD